MSSYRGEYTASVSGIIPLDDMDYLDQDSYEFEATNYVQETYPEASDIQITNVKEI